MSNTILLPFQPDAMTPAQLAAVSYLAGDPAAYVGGDVYRKLVALAGDATDVGGFVAHSGDTYEAVPLFDATFDAALDASENDPAA